MNNMFMYICIWYVNISLLKRSLKQLKLYFKERIMWSNAVFITLQPPKIIFIYQTFPFYRRILRKSNKKINFSEKHRYISNSFDGKNLFMGYIFSKALLLNKNNNNTSSHSRTLRNRTTCPLPGAAKVGRMDNRSTNPTECPNR